MMTSGIARLQEKLLEEPVQFERRPARAVRDTITKEREKLVAEMQADVAAFRARLDANEAMFRAQLEVVRERKLREMEAEIERKLDAAEKEIARRARAVEDKLAAFEDEIARLRQLERLRQTAAVEQGERPQ
jgi:hypothetical protein